jgi:hypothetical protein
MQTFAMEGSCGQKYLSVEIFVLFYLAKKPISTMLPLTRGPKFRVRGSIAWELVWSMSMEEFLLWELLMCMATPKSLKSSTLSPMHGN